MLNSFDEAERELPFGMSPDLAADMAARIAAYGRNPKRDPLDVAIALYDLVRENTFSRGRGLSPDG